MMLLTGKGTTSFMFALFVLFRMQFPKRSSHGWAQTCIQGRLESSRGEGHGLQQSLEDSSSSREEVGRGAVDDWTHTPRRGESAVSKLGASGPRVRAVVRATR